MGACPTNLGVDKLASKNVLLDVAGALRRAVRRYNTRRVFADGTGTVPNGTAGWPTSTYDVA